MTYNVQGEVRSIGNLGSSVEVLAIGILLETNVALCDLGAGKDVEALDFERLLEVDARLAIQAIGLDLGLALEGDSEGLVVVEPDVVSGKGVHVGDFDMLAGVDDLVLVVVGLGERELHKGNVRLVVLEIHLAVESVDVGLDAALCCDCGVDLHEECIALGLEDVYALDF